MTRRSLSCAVVMALASGCWTDDLVNGFSADEWPRLQDEYTFTPRAAPCPTGWPSVGDPGCEKMAALAQRAFFDKDLSKVRDANNIVIRRTEACVDCHDTKNWFIDTRTPNNVSLNGTLMGWTKRNSISLVNSAEKEVRARPGAPVFTWAGAFTTAGSVLDAAVTGAMKTTHADFVKTIVENYAAPYADIFGVSPASQDTETVFNNMELVFDAYVRRLVSASSPFDRFLAGNDAAISDAAKRGFHVFVGPAGCAECHHGALFSDLEPHATGVPPGAVPDAGFGDGTFTTPPLRQIAKTGPYMHDGAFATLGEVIDFYRRGGDASSFPKDPRMVPLDITDADAQDLEAFLETLTGDPVPTELTICLGPSCP